MKPFLFFLLLFSAYLLFSQQDTENYVQQPQATYKVGVAKTDITAFKKGAGMLGYSMAFNTAEGIETHLHARTFVIENESEQKAAIVVCELAFITMELKSAVLEILKQYPDCKGFTEDNLLITAQHTHCGPGGFSHYASYNMSIPGFVAEVFDTLAQKIAAGIIQADANKVPCEIQLSKGIFPEDWEVGFNRSLAAYNKNQGVIPFAPEEKNKAINREMTLLHFTDKNAKPLGSINWFGVHATNISNDHHELNGDNKGYAADFLEQDFTKQNPQYVGAFAQGSAGDVSPKFIFNKKHSWQRGFWEGKYPDDIQSAKYNGDLQYKKAKELIENTQQQQVKTGTIQTAYRYFDFSNIAIDTCFTHTKEVKYTSPSCIGMTMLGGALMDGPAAPTAVVGMGKSLSRLIRNHELAKSKRKNDAWAAEITRKYAAQGVKDIILETGAQKILGTKDIKNLILPGGLDQTIKTFKLQHRTHALGNKPWSPQILPIQLVQIGNVVFAAFPFEITTTAANRLKQSIVESYKDEAVAEVVLCPYSNAYSGYLTTFEEYQVQMYEGGHTVFGEYSLAALQTVFKDLYEKKEATSPEQIQKIVPVTFTKEEISKRQFYIRKWYQRYIKRYLIRMRLAKK